jgi:hypothetical protein
MRNLNIERVVTAIFGTDTLRPHTESTNSKKTSVIRKCTSQQCKETIAPVTPEIILSLHELFAKIQDPRLPGESFHARLEELKNALRPELFPHGRVGEIDMSKYSAIAITHALRVIMGDKAEITTVFGHHDPFRITKEEEEIEHPAQTATHHYWTEITIQGVRYFCDATYGELHYKQFERIIFAKDEELKKHHLYRQTINGTTPPKDIRILLSIHQNGGNPPTDFTKERTKTAYNHLIQCITMYSDGNLTPTPRI